MKKDSVELRCNGELAKTIIKLSQKAPKECQILEVEFDKTIVACLPTAWLRIVAQDER